MVFDRGRSKSDHYILEASVKHHGSDDAEESGNPSAEMLLKYFAHMVGATLIRVKCARKATYDFGQFPEEFKKAVQPEAGCVLVIQPTGDLSVNTVSHNSRNLAYKVHHLSGSRLNRATRCSLSALWMLEILFETKEQKRETYETSKS